MGRRFRLGGTRQIVPRSPAYGGTAAVGSAAVPLPALRMPSSGDPAPNSAPPGPSAPGGVDPAIWRMALQMARAITIRSNARPMPEDEPIPQAVEFEYTGTVATAAPGISAITLDDGTGNPFVLSAGAIARIASVFLIVAGTITVATNQKFTIKANGTPVKGWINRRVVPTASNGYTQPFFAKIRVPMAAQITVEVNNVDGGSYTDGVMLTGWQWPDAAGRAWQRGEGEV